MTDPENAKVAALVGFVMVVLGGFAVVWVSQFFGRFGLVIMAVIGIGLVCVGTYFAIDVATSLGWLNR